MKMQWEDATKIGTPGGWMQTRMTAAGWPSRVFGHRVVSDASRGFEGSKPDEQKCLIPMRAGLSSMHSCMRSEVKGCSDALSDVRDVQDVDVRRYNCGSELAARSAQTQW